MLIDDELAPNMPSPPPVFLVSGGVGASGQQLVNTVLAQFAGPEVPVVIIPHVRLAAENTGQRRLGSHLPLLFLFLPQVVW
jgi:hypothetical protein